MVSRETYEMLKKQLSARDQQVASLRAFKDANDQQTRAFLTETTKSSTEFLASLAESAQTPMQKQMVMGFHDKMANITNTPAEQLDHEMPFAVLVHCASANAKRRLVDDETAKERSEELRKSLARIEELEADNAKKARTISEVTSLAEERHAQTEEACRKLAALTGAARKYDFNIPTSRHSGLAGSANATTAAAASLAAAHLDAQPTKTETDKKLEAQGVPSSIATGGGKAIAPPESGITQTIHAASMGGGAMIAPGSGLLPTAEGFASWSMRMGAGSSRVQRASGPHEILGGQGQSAPSADGAASSSNTASNFDLETAIRAAGGAM